MSSSTFPIICAICALFCSSLENISASKNSTAPIYVRYVRRRPPWFPGDLYVEDVVEEFRTKSRPPMFGSSEIEIQQFLEKDQKLQEVETALGVEVETNSTTPVKGEKRKIGTLRQVKKPPIVELKPTITVTVYKPSDSLEMRVNEFVTPPEPCTTTMKVPYTKVITNSGEIDYYDIDEGWSHIPISESTTTTTTQRPVWKLFGTSTISPKTTTVWTPFVTSKSPIRIPTSTTTTTTATTPRSFWVNFGQTKSTSTTTTEKPTESTVSTATTTQRTYGIFNLFGKSTITTTTTETPTTTITTEFFEEPTTTEFLSSFPDSGEEDKSTTTEIGTLDNLGESIEEVTSIPTTEGSKESINKHLDDDYVNGEVVDSIEEDHTVTSLNIEPTITEESEEITTTKKTKLFSWFG